MHVPSGDKKSFRLWYRELRQRIRALSPYMRRKRHRRMMGQLEEEMDKERRKIVDVAKRFLDLPSFAGAARIAIRVPIASKTADEWCFFVSFAAQPMLKAHVLDHIEALVDEGIAVVLIVNTDHDLSTFQIPESLAARLSGCIVRQNVGFDFAAWAHAYSLMRSSAIKKRLYLINDSIVGPIDRGMFAKLIARVRSSRADLIGLTTNPDPVDHLQSYFLVIGDGLLHSDVFRKFFSGILNLTTKQEVIDFYEVGLSPFVQSKGFKCEAVFPSIAKTRYHRNDTIWSWNKLIELGFPFVKAEVLRNDYDREEAKRLIPDRYLKI